MTNLEEENELLKIKNKKLEDEIKAYKAENESMRLFRQQLCADYERYIATLLEEIAELKEEK